MYPVLSKLFAINVAHLDSHEFNSLPFLHSTGGLSTTAMVKIQVTDINDNRPIFYPREYNVSLREAPTISSATPVIAVVATDLDAGRFGAVSYRIGAGNEAGIFRIDRLSGEIFISRPNMLSSRTQPMHKLNVSASDGGGLRTLQDAEVYISIIDATHRPPIFEKSRYNYYVKEDVQKGMVVGSVLATSSDSGKFKHNFHILIVIISNFKPYCIDQFLFYFCQRNESVAIGEYVR